MEDIQDTYERTQKRLVELEKWFTQNKIAHPNQEDKEAIALLLSRVTIEVPFLLPFAELLMSAMMACSVYGTRKGYELRKLEEILK